MRAIGLDVPRSGIAHTLEEAERVAAEIGLPVIIRPSRTLGGTGGGIAATDEEFRRHVAWGLEASPISEILIEESIAGLEGVRARGDARRARTTSSSSARSRTSTRWACTPATRSPSRRRRRSPTRNTSSCATPRSRSSARSASTPAARTSSSRSIRETGRLVVIEMNPRVSRSSALASQGDRLPDREDRRQARRRLHARRDPQRHHARDAGVLRADDRLRRHQDPALHVREVPAGERRARRRR